MKLEALRRPKEDNHTMRQGLYGLIIGSAMLAAGCGGGGGGSLASVDGTAVTNEDLAEYLKIKPTVRVVTNGGLVAEVPVADTLAFQALQDLMSQEVLLGLAKEKNMIPTDQEVDAEIEFKKTIEKGYVRRLQQRGLTLSQIRRSVRLEMAQERLLTEGITKTLADVEAQVKQNPDAFTEPEKVTLDIIFTPDAKSRDAAEAALKSGKTFADAKREHDKSPAAVRQRFAAGTASGGLAVASLGEGVRNALKALAPGQTTGWLSVDNGFAKFQLNGRTEAKKMELTPERKEYLRRQIALEEGRQKTDLSRLVADKMKEAKIEVKDEALKPLWENFSERLSELPPVDSGTAAQPDQN